MVKPPPLAVRIHKALPFPALMCERLTVPIEYVCVVREDFEISGEAEW
jgi:hypothetical protein